MAKMEGIRNVYRILERKSVRKSPFGTMISGVQCKVMLGPRERKRETGFYDRKGKGKGKVVPVL
jgi:hypothetical protein